MIKIFYLHNEKKVVAIQVGVDIAVPIKRIIVFIARTKIREVTAGHAIGMKQHYKKI